MFQVFPTARLKPSPFYEATLAEGMVAATLYNSMILPTSYGDPDAEYWRLIEGVSQWDVGGERQVQLEGPDAGRLAQVLTVRDLSKVARSARASMRRSATIAARSSTIRSA